MWEPVAVYALEGALRAHGKLDLDRREDWTNLALAYLRVCAVLGGDAKSDDLMGILQGVREVEGKQDWWSWSADRYTDGWKSIIIGHSECACLARLLRSRTSLMSPQYRSW